jgi:hypothetical protein
MGPFRRRLFGLCLPPATAASLDAALTLRGQSAEYWAGNYAQVNELSPTFHHLLAYHPLAFVAGFLGWMFIFAAMILLLPRTLALAMSLAVSIGHTWGATTWFLPGRKSVGRRPPPLDNGTLARAEVAAYNHLENSLHHQSPGDAHA